MPMIALNLRENAQLWRINPWAGQPRPPTIEAQPARIGTSHMLDREEVATYVARRLPRHWERAAAVPGLQDRIVEVLRDPRNGTLDDQIGVLALLLGQGDSLSDPDWLAWASYAFDPQAPRR